MAENLMPYRRSISVSACPCVLRDQDVGRARAGELFFWILRHRVG